MEEFAVEILDLIAQWADLTLVEYRSGELRATDQNQPQLALAFSRPTQHHAQKKCCKQPNGSEQMWRERAAAGYESKVCLALVSRLSREGRDMNLVNEAGPLPSRAWAVPLGRWQTITFVAALRHNKMVAPMVVEGAMTGEMFLAYVENCLVPTLRRNDIVVMDYPGPSPFRAENWREGAFFLSEIFARPQSHRDALQQIQDIPA